MHNPVPVPKPADPHTNTASMTKEPVEISESFTTSPIQPEVIPTVLEIPSDSTPGPDQELFAGMANSPEVETDPMLCQADVSDRPQPIPADPDGPDAEPEVKPTDVCVDLTRRHLKHQQEANHSSLYPAEGPDRASSQNDTSPIHRQVLPDTQTQTQSSVWLFLIIGIAVTLSRSLLSPQ